MIDAAARGAWRDLEVRLRPFIARRVRAGLGGTQLLSRTGDNVVRKRAMFATQEQSQAPVQMKDAASPAGTTPASEVGPETAFGATAAGLKPSAQDAAPLMSHWADDGGAQAGQKKAAGARPTLSLGSNGEDVMALQEALNAHGAQLAPDGAFGPRTRAAVVSFQQQNGLSPDGVVGPMTWGALEGGGAGTGAATTPGAGATTGAGGTTATGAGATTGAGSTGAGAATGTDPTGAGTDPAQATGDKTPGEQFREDFLAKASPGKSIMSQQAIDAQNDKTQKGKFTTCIAFVGQMVGSTKGADGKPIKFQGPNAYKEVNPQAKLSANKDLPPGSYHAGGAGMSERPKPGDLLVLAFAQATKYGEGEKQVTLPAGAFAHICILRSIQPAEDPAKGETWITVDGGGTSSAQRTRTYRPDTGLLDSSLLKGWFDIEKMAGY